MTDITAPIPAILRIRPTATEAADVLSDPHFLPADPADLLHADPTRRIPVRFQSDGLSLAGHLYRPPGIAKTARTPGIVMAGPFASVKEQTLPHYAERFANAGYTVLTFDSRTFGESEGEPRYHFNPALIIEDFANAVRSLLARDDIERGRVAVVGVCMGGGYALATAARLKSVRAVVSIAGGYNIGGSFQQYMGVEGLANYYKQVNDLVDKQYRTGEVQYVPTTAPGLSADIPVAGLPNEEAYSYYHRTHKADAPNWSDRITAASLETFLIYNSIVNAPLVAPAPLLIVHGTRDLFLPPEYARQAYDAALGPKELIWIETHNHIELYDQDPYVSKVTAEVIVWLKPYLEP
jgi:fermentation-respiration switch protein FrsA (DUF1100 family)